MKIDLGDLSYEGRWHDFEGARLKVRIFPASKADVIIKDSGMVISGENQCNIFKYCLESWENVVDAAGKDLACTDEVKQKIFDFNLVPNLITFVLNEVKRQRELKEDLEKN